MGKRISNSVEQFYCTLMEHEELRKMKIYGALKENCMEFYNVCAKFADISLNASKYRIPETCDIQGCFRFEDIERAKWVAKEFYVRKSIEDVDELLEAIKSMYRLAVDFDDTRCSSALIKPENVNSSYGYLGVYYNFAEMPQDIWEVIEKETKEYIQNP